MNHSDFDMLLDEVLQDQAPEPPPGIDHRILACVRDQQMRSKRWVLGLGLSGTCLATCLVVIIASSPKQPSTPRIASSVTPVVSLPKPENSDKVEMALSRHPSPPTSERSSAQRRATVRIRREVTANSKPTPKLNTFPAITQRDDGLLTATPKALQALQELKAEQQQPLQINAIEIQPL